MPTQTVDAVIVGGGIAGMWALKRLQECGYSVILLEAHTLGCDQTLASQGMIHGGLKYALAGNLTGASEAIAAMPQRWRACLEGAGEVNLRGVRLLSDRYYMFAARSTLNRLTAFFASKALRGRIDKLARRDWPAEFSGFDGVVYTLNDFVLDTVDLLDTLCRGQEHRIFQLEVGANCIQHGVNGGWDVSLCDTRVHARQLISCAGNGSAALIRTLGIADIEIQKRPLKQVIVKPRHRIKMYGHCLTGISSNEPRLTITSHEVEGELRWYLGGQLATTGVQRSDSEQITQAEQELRACVPWLDWRGADLGIVSVNRAEPRQTTGVRPDQAYVQRVGDFIQCFPTKLTLAPDLGDRLLQVLDPPSHGYEIHSGHPRARIGSPPW